MTEQEWLACTDPQPMLELVQGKASDRKLRLFAVACCRKIGRRLTDSRSLRAVEVAERYADGVAHEQDREEAWQGADDVREDAVAEGDFERASAAVSAKGCLAQSKDQVMRLALHFRHWMPVDVLLVKDIFGNPCRAVAVEPAVLAWNGDTIPRLAQAAYDERSLPSGYFDPARLAVLADALEDAGCDQADLLAHLRGPGPHVRGCWAVDLILGKQ